MTDAVNHTGNPSGQEHRQQRREVVWGRVAGITIGIGGGRVGQGAAGMPHRGVNLSSPLRLRLFNARRALIFPQLQPDTLAGTSIRARRAHGRSFHREIAA